MMFLEADVMRLSVFIVCSLFLVISCSKDEENEQLPTKPVSMNTIDSMTSLVNDSKKVEISGNQDVDTKPIGTDEEINCTTLCRHTSYCEQTMKGKSASRKEKLCVNKCNGDTSETGKTKFETMMSCLDKNRGDKCLERKTCVTTKFVELKGKLKISPRETDPAGSKGE
jgi:hypothetical protein